MSTLTKIRLVVGVEGTDAIARIAPHATDPDLVVVKGPTASAVLALCKAMGQEPGDGWQGSNYWMATLTLEQLTVGLAKLAMDTMIVAREMAEVTKKKAITQGDAVGALQFPKQLVN